MIAIIVAMGKELELLLGLLDSHTVDDGDPAIHYGRIGGKDVALMQCGIGKVNAALGAAALIDKCHPAMVINSGVAGGTGAGASVADIVLANKVAYHDVWLGPGTTAGQAGDCPLYFLPPSTLDVEAVAREIGAKTGLVASGDIFVCREDDLKRILEVHPGAIAVDMESAAIAQVCHKRGVPMVCLRIVSDTPGQHDNFAQYTNFWADAPVHTFKAVSQLIEKV